MLGEASYFRLRTFKKLPKFEFDLVRDVYLLYLDPNDIDDPKSVPVCMYHYAGIQRYLWDSRTWSQCDVGISSLLERASELLAATKDPSEAKHYREIIDLVKLYKITTDVRAIYEIED